MREKGEKYHKERYLTDSREAAIANAGAVLELRAAGTPLPELVWSYRLDGPAPRSAHDWHATTPGSEALSKELRRAGFRFVGPTTVYSTMQACGIVNDHLATCPARAATERARQAVASPG